MIVTFDTGILVRATKRSRGRARRAIEAIAAATAHAIALSAFIIGEVGKVLAYPRMQAIYGLTADEIHEHVRFLEAIARIVEPEMGIPVVLSDPHDDAVLYTAVSAGSDVLCFRDRDFYTPESAGILRAEFWVFSSMPSDILWACPPEYRLNQGNDPGSPAYEACVSLYGTR